MCYCGIQCDYKAKLKSNLIQHTKYVHEGIHYACDLCDYKAGEKQCLQEHIMSIHEGNYYLCYQCDHQATLKSSLIKHQTSFISKYKIHICNETTKKKRICEICDYKAKMK